MHQTRRVADTGNYILVERTSGGGEEDELRGGGKERSKRRAARALVFDDDLQGVHGDRGVLCQRVSWERQQGGL
jgi:hypothetical protein